MKTSDIIAVVTGAGSGVGACVATTLARRGSAVALIGRREAKLQQVQRDIQSAGGRAEVFVCDVSDPAAVQKLRDDVRRRLGIANLLFNGAGVFNEVVPLAQSDPGKWIETMQINLYGPYLVCREFTGDMVEKRWGRIINVSSAASILPPGGHSSAYQLSKVALNHFTRQLAAELNGTGVTANVLHPGEVKTEMWAAIKAESAIRGNQGMQNWANMVEQTGGDPPEKTAELVLQLIEPAGDDVNGQFLWIKGGIKKPVAAW